MNILLIGSGAREHAIAKAFKKSPSHPQLFCCGTSHNPGIQKLSKEYWVGDINNLDQVIAKAKEWNIQLAIIGPETPLEKGLADALWLNHIPTVGPKKVLAQLETSKAFTRELLTKYHIEGSPRYQVFQNLNGIEDFLKQLGDNGYVIKANGLMGGKGVKVAGDHLHSFQEALQFCEEIFKHGQTCVIEERLIGQEFSMLCFSDGNTLIPLPLVQDHKRAFVNDEGPNTGGMGSYSDANHSLPFLTPADIQAAQAINTAVIKALKTEHQENFIGILYGSFMATQDGVRLIEFNVRFGDPEAMNVLALLESDFVAICQAMVTQTLHTCAIQFANKATVCKYAVPKGYPDQPEKNFPIDVSQIENPEQLYLAAVDERDGVLYATGSRTAAVVGIADTIAAAEQIAEAEVRRISGQVFHRPDIGTQSLIQQRIQQMQELRQCAV